MLKFLDFIGTDQAAKFTEIEVFNIDTYFEECTRDLGSISGDFPDLLGSVSEGRFILSFIFILSLFYLFKLCFYLIIFFLSYVFTFIFTIDYIFLSLFSLFISCFYLYFLFRFSLFSFIEILITI